MNKLGIRCRVFGMDARRKARRMVVPFASLATPQMPEYAATLRAGAGWGAFRCCEPFVVNAQLRVSRLGLHPNQPQRMPNLSIRESFPFTRW